MTFQSAPECAEAVIRCSFGGHEIDNVLNFWYPTGYDQGALDDLADVVDNRVGLSYLGQINNLVTYDETRVRGLENAIDLEAVNAGCTAAGSASGSVPLPGNVTLCITLRTGFTGRSARGRFYALPTESDKLNTANVFDAAYATAIEGFLTSLKADALAVGWTFVVLSRRTGGALRPVAIKNPVTVIAARNLEVDSAKRRLAPGH